MAFDRSLAAIPFFTHDNNHILNTIFIHLMGPNASIFSYRLIPLVCGIASLLFIYITPVYKNKVERYVTLTIFSLSYFFVLYSSEARGYAYLALFLSVSFYLLHKIFNKEDDLFYHSLFWLSCTLGLISHYLFAIFFVSALVWTAFYKRKLSLVLKLYTIPACFYAVVYLSLIKHMERSGDPAPVLAVSDLAFKSLLGFMVPSLVCFFVYLYMLLKRRRKDGSNVFYVSLFLLGPMMMFALPSNAALYARYLFVYLFFFVFILSEFIALLIVSDSKVKKVIGIALMTLVVLGSINKDIRLYVYGRGDYKRAVLDVLNNSEMKDHIRLGVDHKFRDREVFDFYLSMITTKGPKIDYVDINESTPPDTEWLIYRKFDNKEIDSSPKEVSPNPNLKFRLFKIYRYDQGLSGWNWVIYKRV